MSNLHLSKDILKAKILITFIFNIQIMFCHENMTLLEDFTSFTNLRYLAREECVSHFPSH